MCIRRKKKQLYVPPLDLPFSKYNGPEGMVGGVGGAAKGTPGGMSTSFSTDRQTGRLTDNGEKIN